VLLTVEGFQVPIILLFDCKGREGAVVPMQKVVAKLKVGVIVFVTVIGIVTGFPHPPVGVKA